MQKNASTPTKESLWNEQRTGSGGGVLDWWYALAAPVEPPNATAADRERVRAGRLSSIILVIMLCFGISQVPNALLSSRPLFLIVLLISMSINIGVFVLNRQGMALTVGIIMVVVTELGFIILVVALFSPLTAGSLTIFMLIILTELMAVSLLPPKSVFLVTLCNWLFTILAIVLLPHAATFKLSTPSAYYSVLAGPLVLQMIVAVVTYLWVQGAREAIARAERVAALERALAERDRAEAEQKHQLEEGIQHILQTLVVAANGHVDARAPLAKENVLWQVAYGLNTLLARLQRAIQSENDLQRTKQEALRLQEAIRSAKKLQYPLQTSRSGTVLDPVAQELNGNYIYQP